jgi:hypothetical protein
MAWPEDPDETQGFDPLHLDRQEFHLQFPGLLQGRLSIDLAQLPRCTFRVSLPSRHVAIQ